MSNKQKVGLKRNTIDKYYTKPSVVSLCLELIKKNVKITDNDIIIEPSAGNGSFIEGIKNISNNYLFYDLEPENREISKQDYLSLETNNYSNKIHVIGNPPFGRQSSLAIQFIKKSCEFCYSLSFILPKSFKKNSKKQHFPLEYHLICEQDLPKNSFQVDGKDYDVPCVFQIWIKKSKKRKKPKKLVPKNFKFVKKDENPDISFRRVGGTAGNISKNILDKSIQSHYFIKFDNELTEEKFENLKHIDFKSKDDTVGARSISKQELIKEFNMIL